jgi:CBS domain-containing protein
MLVKDAMNKKVMVIKPNATAREAARAMAKYRIGSLLVIEKNRLVGIVTELDIIWKVVAGDLDPNTTLVKDIMTKKVIAIRPNKTLEDATHVMVEKRIKKLPVLDDKKLVGILTCTDLVTIQPKLIEALGKLMLFEEKKAVAG